MVILDHTWRAVGPAFSPDEYTGVEYWATLAWITRGNVRLGKRLFAQVKRMLEISRRRTITKEVVETARESLVIGSQSHAPPRH